MPTPPPPPHINSLSPTSGPVGTHVLIAGTNFKPGSIGPIVHFNGVTATLLSVSNTSILAIVPVGATTGNVDVENISVSNGVLFTVNAPPPSPHITSLTPSNGGVGISVVVAGMHFGATQSTSTITFNGVAAMVVSWSDTSITVTVPSLATTGPVVVTTSVGASNGVTFTVTNPSNGGMSGPLNLLLIPAEAFSTAVIWAFDPTNFNDTQQGSFYSWKVEDVLAGRQPTIDRVIISYRDLGVATLTVTLTGVNDAAEVVTETQDIALGTVAASGKICTQLVGISLSGTNLQLSVERLANGGPVSITKVRMEGRVEITVY